jgi:class 3 adenylate cyclase
MEWLSRAQRWGQEGELFRAYDVVRQGLAQFPDDLALKHRAVLYLASTGATRNAIGLLDQFGLDEARQDAKEPISSGLWQDVVTQTRVASQLGLDIASLRPRLMKDEALAMAGSARRQALAAAAERYAEVYRDANAAGNPGAYYPAVNAATLYLLCGDTGKARTFAHIVVETIDHIPNKERDYYELVSAVEAHLVLGDSAAAGEFAAQAHSLQQVQTNADYRALASTVRQLQLVVAANRITADWLTNFVPPKVIHYAGHIIAAPGNRGRFPADQETAIAKAIEEELDSDRIGFAYGSLAAGSDILFAEALLRRGRSLHVLLPFSDEEFIERSVRPSGEDWVQRFHACRERAVSVQYATEDEYLGDAALFSYCGQLAMGLALLRARMLGADVKQIAVWDGRPSKGLAGTAVDIRNWSRSGMPQTIIPWSVGIVPAGPTNLREAASGRRTRAILFGDFHNFSRLTDAQLPLFVERVLGRAAAVIDRYGENVLLRNTWGDGLYLIFDDAGKAADCALELQLEIAALDLGTMGLPPEMGLRMGGHLGPIYHGRDPIIKQLSFFGAHVSRAARVEPVTPEGCVYVTETLAAVLALHNSKAFVCDYVGMTEAAKKYGAMRMFLLRRRS